MMLKENYSKYKMSLQETKVTILHLAKAALHPHQIEVAKAKKLIKNKLILKKISLKQYHSKMFKMESLVQQITTFSKGKTRSSKG